MYWQRASHESLLEEWHDFLEAGAVLSYKCTPKEPLCLHLNILLFMGHRATSQQQFQYTKIQQTTQQTTHIYIFFIWVRKPFETGSLKLDNVIYAACILTTIKACTCTNPPNSYVVLPGQEVRVGMGAFYCGLDYGNSWHFTVLTLKLWNQLPLQVNLLHNCLVENHIRYIGYL